MKLTPIFLALVLPVVACGQPIPLAAGATAPSSGVFYPAPAAVVLKAKLQQLAPLKAEVAALRQQTASMGTVSDVYLKEIAIQRDRAAAYQKLAATAERAARAQRKRNKIERILFGVSLLLLRFPW